MRRLLLLLVLCCISSASAIQISEIMYNPSGSDTGHEWIEVYNNESSAINLTGWKFVESGTNHGLNLVNGGEILDIGTYAIIADNSNMFLQDYPTFTGTLFDSSFSLSNTGEYLALKDSNSTVVENITYADIAEEGKTLQLVDEDFCEGDPTPGAANKCTDNEEPTPPQEEQYDLKLEVKIQNATEDTKAKNLFKLTNLDYGTNQSYMNVTVEFNVKLNGKQEYADTFTVQFKQSKSTGTGTWTPESFGTYEICGEIIDAPFEDPDESNNDNCADIEVFESQENETTSTVEATENASLALENQTQRDISQASEKQSTGAYIWTSKTTPNASVLLFVGVLLILTVSLLLTIANFKRHNI